MSDEVDRATDQQAIMLTSTIKRIAGAAQGRGESLKVCLECGDDIPEKRREAVPGCTLCIECQKWADKGGGFWP